MALLTSRLNKLQKLLVLSQTCKKTICTTSASRRMWVIQNEKEFHEKVRKSDKPVVLDFQAGELVAKQRQEAGVLNTQFASQPISPYPRLRWCQFNKVLEGRLQDAVGKRYEKVHLAKIDADELSFIALEFDVEELPHVVGYKNGKLHSEFIGMKSEEEVESFVEELISDK